MTTAHDVSPTPRQVAAESVRATVAGILDCAQWLTDRVPGGCAASGVSRGVPEGSNGAHIGD